MCCRRWITALPGTHCFIHNARMLVIVAIQAKQLPVAAIWGIVIVIVILVMHRQLAQTNTRKLASASPAYPRKQFERLLAIPLLTQFTLLSRFENDSIQSSMVR